MFVKLVVGFEVLSISEAVSAHVRVSVAHVMVIVLHSSAKDTRVVFVKEVVGFEVFTSAI